MTRSIPTFRTAMAALSLVLTFATACSSGGSGPDDDPDPVGGIALSLSMSGATVANGGLVPVTATLTRTGGFTGTVNFTVEGVPAGVTGSIANVATSGTTTTATITITTSVAAVGGTYPLTVRATGSGVTDATATFTLIIAVGGSYGLTATPNTLSIARGSTGTSVISVGRIGGFTGNVTLGVEGAPTGVTATLAPPATTGTTSTLTVAVAAGAATGNSTLTIRGTAAGQPERTVTIALTVTTSGGGGGNAVSFDIACQNPVWAAYQDGDGPFTQVIANGQGLYTFNISANRAAFAYATAAGTQAMVAIIRMSRAEMTAAPQSYCGVATQTKFINSTLAGVGAGDRAQVWLGGAGVSRTSDGAFSIIGLATGPQDLVAFRKSLVTVSPNPTRGLIRRDLDPANASTIAPVDMAGAESFLAATAPITVPNFAAGETVATTMNYRTGASCSFAALYQQADLAQAVSPVTVEGIPASAQRGSDIHQISLTAITGGANISAARVVQENFGALVPRTVTLPPALPIPTVTTLAGPYKRLQGVYEVPAPYVHGTSFTYVSFAPLRTVVMSATTGWLGGSSATMAMPDFTATAGWHNEWAPAAAATGNWAAQANGSNFNGNNLCQADGRIVSADQRGSF